MLPEGAENRLRIAWMAGVDQGDATLPLPQITVNIIADLIDQA
jgi:hypothetical protein